jgi:hypothetical protein
MPLVLDDLYRKLEQNEKRKIPKKAVAKIEAKEERLTKPEKSSTVDDLFKELERIQLSPEPASAVSAPEVLPPEQPVAPTLAEPDYPNLFTAIRRGETGEYLTTPEGGRSLTEQILFSPRAAKHPKLAALVGLLEPVAGTFRTIEKATRPLSEIQRVATEAFRKEEPISEALKQYFAGEKKPIPLGEQTREALETRPTIQQPPKEISTGIFVTKPTPPPPEHVGRPVPIPTFAQRFPITTDIATELAEFADLRVILGAKGINKIVKLLNKLPILGEPASNLWKRLVKTKKGKVDPADIETFVKTIEATAKELEGLTSEQVAKIPTQEVNKRLTKTFLTLKEAGRRTSEQVAARRIGKKGLREAIVGKKKIPTPQEMRTAVLETTPGSEAGKALRKELLAKKAKAKGKEITRIDKALKELETPGVPTTVSKTLLSAREAAKPTVVPTKVSPALVSAREIARGKIKPVETLKKVEPTQLPKTGKKPQIEIVSPPAKPPIGISPATEPKTAPKIKADLEIAGIPIKELKVPKKKIEPFKLLKEESISKLKAAKPVDKELFPVKREFPKGKIKPKKPVKEGLPMVEEIARREAEKAQIKLPPKTITIKAPPTKKMVFDPEKHSLADFVRHQGGISSQREALKGEVRQFNIREGFNLINNKTGKTFEELRVSAVEEGFLSKDSTVSDFIDLLANDVYAKAYKKPGRVWSPRKQSFDIEEEFSLGQMIKDINTLLGERGAIGKAPKTPKQVIAQQRLEQQVDDMVRYFKERGIKTAAQIEKTMKDLRMPENIAQMALKRMKQAVPPAKAPIEYKKTVEGKYEDTIKQHENLGKALIQRGEKNGNKDLIKKGMEELQKAKLNERTSKLDELFPDFSQMPPYRPGAIRQLKDWAITSNQKQIAKYGGKEGKEINRFIRVKEVNEKLIRASFEPHIEKLDSLMKRFGFYSRKSEQKILKAVQTGDTGGLSPKEIKAYETFRNIYKLAAEGAEKRNIKIMTGTGEEIPWRGRENPFSLMYDEAKIVRPEFREKALKYLEDHKERISKALGFGREELTRNLKAKRARTRSIKSIKRIDAALAKLKKGEIPDNLTGKELKILNQTKSAEELWEIWRDTRLGLNVDKLVGHIKKGDPLPERFARNLEFSRVFEIPGYETDLRYVADAYANQVSRRFAEIDGYGKGYKLIFDKLRDIHKGPHAGNLNEVIHYIADANRWHEIHPLMEWWSTAARSASAPLLAVSQPVSLIGGNLQTAIRGGIFPMAKYSLKTIPWIRKLSQITGRDALEFGRELGFNWKNLNFTYLEGMVRSLPEKLARQTIRSILFKWTEDVTKTVASMVGRDHMYWLLKKAVKKKKLKFTQGLRELALRDNEIKTLMLDYPKLTKKQMFEKHHELFKRGALEFVNFTQGLPSRHRLPASWNTPAGNTITQFKKVVYELTGEVANHFSNIFKFPDRVARWALLSPPAGYLTYHSQRKLRNLIREATGGRPLKKKEQTEEMLAAAAKVNMMGFYAELIYYSVTTAEYDPYRALVRIAGPTASKGGAGLETVGHIVTRIKEPPEAKKRKEAYYEKRGLKRPSVFRPVLRSISPVVVDIMAPPPVKKKKKPTGFPNIKREAFKGMPIKKGALKREAFSR